MGGSNFQHKKYAMMLVVAGAVVVLDQITKAMILHYLPLYKGVEVIPGFLNITHIQNPGGAFGFMARYNSSLVQVFFTVFAILALGIIVYFYHRTPTSFRTLRVAFALLCGGAVANLIDRVRLGKVVDFLDFHLAGLHWPAFNVADSAVTIGIFIFAYHLVFNKLPD